MPLWANPDGSLACNPDGTLIDDTRAAFEACCCDPSPAPCECPQDLPTSYRVQFSYRVREWDARDCTGTPTCDSTIAVDTIVTAGSPCGYEGPIDGETECEYTPPMIGLDLYACQWRVGTGDYGAWAYKGTGQTPAGAYVDGFNCHSYDTPDYSFRVDITDVVVSEVP